MDNIIDVTGGKGGNAFLILGQEQTALVDCGMAYCASNLIDNIKQALKTMTLNYILITHSHYDHIGAIPYLKKEWPGSRVLGAQYAKQILNRANALKTIRDLSVQAAKIFADGLIQEYDDELMKVDGIIGDGDIISLGGVNIEVIETPGHTKCSLSFLVNNQTLFSSESTGTMSKSGKFHAGFITSSSDAVHSIKRCQIINPRFIISPHFGLVSEKDTADYWENCLLIVKETKDFIVRLTGQGYDEDMILTQFEQAFRDKESKLEQPAHAFRLNAKNMIKSVVRERGETGKI